MLKVTFKRWGEELGIYSKVDILAAFILMILVIRVFGWEIARYPFVDREERAFIRKGFAFLLGLKSGTTPPSFLENSDDA